MLRLTRQGRIPGQVVQFPATRARPPCIERDAVVRLRRFKPRFPPVASHQGESPWLHEDSWMQHRREGCTVWERIGVNKEGGAAGKNHSKLRQSEEGGHLLALLKAKAGARRCFNYLALDYRISQCRDPPMCLVCARSRHKARYCPRSRTAAGALSAAVWHSNCPPVAR
jgi:hypothetical protein